MSDTASALRAAREVQADTLAPELFRQAREWFGFAKREFKLKNFSRAEEYARKARLLAELAELEAVRGGASRSDQGGADPYSNMPPPPEEPVAKPTGPPRNPEDEYEKPKGIYYESYEEGQKKQEAAPKTTP